MVTYTDLVIGTKYKTIDNNKEERIYGEYRGTVNVQDGPNSNATHYNFKNGPNSYNDYNVHAIGKKNFIEMDDIQTTEDVTLQTMDLNCDVTNNNLKPTDKIQIKLINQGGQKPRRKSHKKKTRRNRRKSVRRNRRR